ncbi:hypothetical protein pv_252 [Pithovirus sibericum]|uniref:Uncharacterized protein n=1 Tax=Pithovirus sibericum TaxID=1450746 RepID=W5S578_9VIRU|nr:hypothetical protein pv_252 [Pithovirus sibericum]AHH01819.1 hypothetical protein pv_252 [Pithovirus sibericum]
MSSEQTFGRIIRGPRDTKIVIYSDNEIDEEIRRSIGEKLQKYVNAYKRKSEGYQITSIERKIEPEHKIES